MIPGVNTKLVRDAVLAVFLCQYSLGSGYLGYPSKHKHNIIDMPGRGNFRSNVLHP